MIKLYESLKSKFEHQIHNYISLEYNSLNELIHTDFSRLKKELNKDKLKK